MRIPDKDFGACRIIVLSRIRSSPLDTVAVGCFSNSAEVKTLIEKKGGEKRTLE